MLVEEFRIRTEAGEALTVDDYLLAHPTRANILRPKLKEIEAEQRQLAAEIQLRIFHHQQLVYSEALEREVVLGRQRQGEREQYQRLKGEGSDRIVIASFRDRYVSREHVKLKPLPNGHVRVENCSKKNAISLSSLATLLLPGQFAECSLPITIDIESRQILLKRGGNS